MIPVFSLFHPRLIGAAPRNAWHTAALPLLLGAALLVSSCASSRPGGSKNWPHASQSSGTGSYSTGFYSGAGANSSSRNNADVTPRSGTRNAPAPRGLSGYAKDNKPSIWISDHPRVVHFRDHYRRTRTVEKALETARPYLPTIQRVFERQRLPRELAYLPMLESLFENRANSGHALGMWQFTRQTARHVDLQVSGFGDERLNWRKSTEAAARYLDELGEKFNYNWALALAAYNGGPGYLEKEMRRQRTWSFFDLRLRKETYEYVPRFLGMLQVAREKFPHLMLAQR